MTPLWGWRSFVVTGATGETVNCPVIFVLSAAVGEGILALRFCCGGVRVWGEKRRRKYYEKDCLAFTTWVFCMVVAGGCRVDALLRVCCVL